MKPCRSVILARLHTLGGPIRKNKTFFFIDGEQKDQLHGIPFQGLVPTAAVRTGDFSADNFGKPVGQIVVTNLYMSGASAVPNLPNPNPSVPNNIYFQCDPATGNPIPLVSVASGQQQQGTPCNKIPGTCSIPLASR